MTGRFKFVSEIQEADRKAGRYFFEVDTMRFFRSKIATWYVWDGRYFITSEQNVWLDEHHQRHAEPRRFTIREAVEDNTGFHIDTVGEFQAYGTLAQARDGVKRLLVQEALGVVRTANWHHCSPECAFEGTDAANEHKRAEIDRTEEAQRNG